ncbi:fucolectin-like [Physella acuta]|uniref:fucolectin-like n=1 Tax=Physella acuta TaxID=109671 RepID=UPI0027DB495C|nr:fucolectin-like [Physella acuta]
MALGYLTFAFCVTYLQTCLVLADLYNVALYKPSYQSSDFLDRNNLSFWAALANDGNLDYNLDNRHCQHTLEDQPGWWMVDLRGVYTVEQIIITNRGDDSSYLRTQNYQIDVFQTDPRLSSNFQAAGVVCYIRVEPLGQGETYTRNCTTPAVGRFVRFIRYTKDYMNVCEIQVMSSQATIQENYFSVRKNYLLPQTPYYTTHAGCSYTCITQCLQRRDNETCTALNWIRTSNECQMFKLDPRFMPMLQSDLTSDFYMEK